MPRSHGEREILRETFRSPENLSVMRLRKLAVIEQFDRLFTAEVKDESK